MAVSPDFKEFVVEILESFGPVTVRSMFGGAGVFSSTPDGKLMFGLIGDDTLYFKTDEQNRPDFEAEGVEEFIFELKDDRRVPSGYFRVPDRLLEDPEELREWADKAFCVALRAAARKKSGKGKGKSQNRR